MLIERFLNEEQDPKTIEKVLGKLKDLLSSNEDIIYIAVQKRPAVNLLPDCIAVTTKRIFYCEPANFGITMNFKDISWKSIKEVSFKEEFFGSKFICVPQHGENLVTEFIPKVQARKLYQAAKEQLDHYHEEVRSIEKDEKQLTENFAFVEEAIEIPAPVQESLPAPPPTVLEEPEDETTLKLRKLKTLFDKQLITLEEYEAKKASILESF
ncbi:PH domain-containing protein [Pedobacter immunditicola]|uniref:PH domain-containing protein n=1 Tax=Pedobacter immunditicola TaxID=3133440 RepID=UPI0030B36A3B